MEDHISLLKSIARAVACEVQSRIGEIDPGKVVGNGSDGTKTELIDQIAEDVVLELLEDKGFNILSEESGYIDKGGDLTILVDPIDGTNNCIMGIPFYCVSLAIGTKKLRDVSAGVVLNLVTNEMFWAVKGQGAFLDDKSIGVRGYNPRESVFSLYIGSKAPSEAFRYAKWTNKVRTLGSTALELCYVAKGSFDLFFQAGQNVRVTDVAASCLILREAGGEIYDMRKVVFDMHYDLNIRKTMIALGDRRLLKTLFKSTTSA